MALPKPSACFTTAGREFRVSVPMPAPRPDIATAGSANHPKFVGAIVQTGLILDRRKREPPSTKERRPLAPVIVGWNVTPTAGGNFPCRIRTSKIRVGSRTKAVSRGGQTRRPARRPAAGRAEQAGSSRVVSSSADKTIRGPALKPGLCLFQRTKPSGRFGLLVHGGFGYLSQKSVGLLFLLRRV